MNKKSNLDVLFVVPPLFRFINIDMQSYPLGLGYVVSYLKKENIKAEIYNSDYIPKTKLQQSARIAKIALSSLLSSYNPNLDIATKFPSYYSNVNDRNHKIWKDFEIVLQKTQPKIIGISSRIVDMPSTFILAKIVKEILPDTKIIVGGASASSSTEYLLSNKDIDYLVIGEGEKTTAELVSFILTHRGIKSEIEGIAYVDHYGNKQINEPRKLISNLDTIPFPDRDSMFVIDNKREMKYIHLCNDIITSRGCPYDCKFCSAYTVWGTRTPRMRSVENIIQEITYLNKTYKQTDFLFWDDLFTINRKRIFALCHQILSLDFKITWRCLVRINTIDEELLALMKSAGCYEIQIGIESGNDRILKHINKKITLELIHSKIPIIKSSRINWLAFFIIGFPTETTQEINDTINLIKKIKPDTVAISIFSPYPGTKFYSELKSQNKLGIDIMKSDVWWINNNYTGTIDNESFKLLAKKAIKFNDKYNNTFLKFMSKIFRYIFYEKIN